MTLTCQKYNLCSLAHDSFERIFIPCVSIVSNYIINIKLIEYVIKEHRISIPFVDFRFSIIRTLSTHVQLNLFLTFYPFILKIVEIFLQFEYFRRR